MTLTKDEFKVLIMLYVSNIDGQIHKDEVEVMLERADAVTFSNVRKLFKKMSDSEIVDCINVNKAKFLVTDDDRHQMMEDLKVIVMADERCSVMERYIFNTLSKIIG